MSEIVSAVLYGLGWLVAIMLVFLAVGWPISAYFDRKDKKVKAAEQRVLEQGAFAVVTVESFRKAPVADSVDFTLTVELPDRAPVSGTYRAEVFIMDAARMDIGARFPAKVDPDDLRKFFAFPRASLEVDPETLGGDGKVTFERPD
jgi:hypothetical protein